MVQGDDSDSKRCRRRSEASCSIGSLFSVTFPDPDHSIGESRYVIINSTKKMSEDQLEDGLRPEYDFSKMSGGVQGKYSERYQSVTNLVLLAPDVAQAFPTEESVKEALHLLMKVAQRQHR